MSSKRRKRRQAARIQAKKQIQRVDIAGRAVIAAAAGDTATAPTFEAVVNTGEPMRIGWFDAPVVVDLATLNIKNQRIPVLYDHCPDTSHVVGQTDSLKIGDSGLTASGKILVNDSIPDPDNHAKKILSLARQGYQWQISIGADTTKVERVEAGKSVNVNGKLFTGPLYVARGCVAREISFVVLGGDRHTSAIVSGKSAIQGENMSFEEWCTSKGFDPATLSDQQKTYLMELFNEEVSEEEVTAAEDDPEEEEEPTNAGARSVQVKATDAAASYRQQVAAEERRIADVRRVCATANNPEIEVTANGVKQKVSLQAHAIEQGWDANRTELEALRRSRPEGPAIISRSHDRDCTLQALQGAMLLRCGAKLDNKKFQSRQAAALNLPQWLRAGLNDAERNRVMEAAYRYDDMSMVDLCREAIRLDGGQVPHNRGEMIRAAFSGSSLANIYTTNVNASLLASYMEAGDTTESWTTTTDVADFKSNERARVDVGPGLARLPRGGEADHAYFSDSYESYKAYRYAKQFVVDEQDIIDDRLGALSDTPARLGAAAARVRADLVYAIMLANDNLNATSRQLFNATDGNLGSSSALTAANLRAAIAAFNVIRENSVNLNLTPTHLIVPPSLRFTGRELIASSSLIVTTGTNATVERGSMNVLTEEGLSLVSDGRLENGVTDPVNGESHSGSATTWYMASTMAHTIEVAYLRGSGRAPRVRSWPLTQGKFGMGWDVVLDIGAKALDWKGLRKTTA